MRQLTNENFKGVSNKLTLQKNAIEQYPGDSDLFQDDVFESSERIQKVVNRNKEEYPPIEKLVEDIYFAFFKYKPTLTNPDSMELDYVLNSQVIETLLDTKEYSNFRSSAKLDSMSSKIATEIFAENIMGLVKEIDEKQKEAKEEAKKIQKEIQDLKDELEEKGLLPESKKFKLQEAKEELRKKREEMRDEFDKKNVRQLENKIEIILKETKKTEKCIQNWGLGNNDSFQKMGYRDKVKLIDELKSSSKLNKISLLAGKLKEIYFDDKRSKTKRRQASLQGIEEGNNVGRAIPYDLLGLVESSRINLFYKKYSERKLRQYEYSGTSEKGKGPIIALIDTSSSMSGQAEVWSKAVALTLLNIAKKQNRNFLAVHFDSGTHEDYLHTNFFSKEDPLDIKNTIDMAEYFGGGGTEFQPCLNRARTEINKNKALKKSDIIMITDGQSAVDDSWLDEYKQWKEKKDVTIYSILITNGFSSSTSTLDEFSDTVQTIDDVQKQGNNTAVDVFNHLEY